MHAMPVLILVLCIMAIAYRYYSAFIAAKVAALDDSRVTPANRLGDGQNFHPTNKWVLFGHHFAAISGAGPLIGPVLAAQFGYLPGMLWIVIGVCLGGAVQDFLVLAASTRRNGHSLARMAFDEINKTAGLTAMLAILFIVIVALAGLGKVVVKALGGDTVPLPGDAELVANWDVGRPVIDFEHTQYVLVHSGTEMRWNSGKNAITNTEGFAVRLPHPSQDSNDYDYKIDPTSPPFVMPLPAGSVRIVPGSPWGTFTIACTIPIALFVGLYMYRIRKGRIVEASIIGGVLAVAATVAGGWITRYQIGDYFNLTSTQVVWAMAAYGFVASVLPVWLLLAPRDYLSSFLKIGTIILLVIGVIVANPKFEAKPYNAIFAGAGGGPVVGGRIFPFLFITIMCGAISGFHALVSSGTTSKMIEKESHARMIGYGSMMIEGLVGVLALIAASTLPPGDYYAMNMEIAKAPAFHEKLTRIGADMDHLNLWDDYTQESLRGRTGGAVTLAVGMAHIFQDATTKFVSAGDSTVRALWKYWYHFAIMFEALFILTTIDAGTRIGRFLLQEVFGKINPKLGRHDSWPGTIISTALIVWAWAYFINSNSFAAIWAMFGIANQMLAVIALSILTVIIAREGKMKYIFVTLGPLLFVATTTTTAALELLDGYWLTISTQLAKATPDHMVLTNAIISGSLMAFVVGCTYLIMICGAIRIWPLVANPRQTNTAFMLDASN